MTTQINGSNDAAHAIAFEIASTPLLTIFLRLYQRQQWLGVG